MLINFCLETFSIYFLSSEGEGYEKSIFVQQLETKDVTWKNIYLRPFLLTGLFTLLSAYCDYENDDDDGDYDHDVEEDDDGDDYAN